MIQAPPDQVAYVTLRLMSGGAMSIEGHAGDINLAIGMLKSAIQTLQNRIGKPTILEPHGAGLVVPNREVNAPQNPVYPLEAVGSRT